MLKITGNQRKQRRNAGKHLIIDKIGTNTRGLAEIEKIS
jgi:hypothetical protein